MAKYYEKHINTITPFGIVLQTHVETSEIHMDNILTNKCPSIPPWNLIIPPVNLDMGSSNSA